MEKGFNGETFDLREDCVSNGAAFLLRLRFDFVTEAWGRISGSLEDAENLWRRARRERERRRK